MIELVVLPPVMRCRCSRHGVGSLRAGWLASQSQYAPLSRLPYLLVCFEAEAELRQEVLQLTEFNDLKHAEKGIMGHGEICRKNFYHLRKDLPFRTEVISYCNSIVSSAAPCCDDAK